MILRRVIEHVRDQNWTAVGIDFCIVVIGVFVGIQVANWNEARADERLGRAYAARLVTDLENDLTSRRQLVAYYGAVLDSVERANALLADPQADPRALVIAAYRATEVNYIPGSRATWDEIVSSGDTGLLPQAAARRTAEYFSFDSAQSTFDVLEDSRYRQQVRTIIPLGVQKALRAGCSDVRDEGQQIRGFMADCRLDVDATELAATAAALRSDPDVIATLRYQFSDVVSAKANIQGDVVAIERALAALKGRPTPAGPTP